MVGTLLNYNPYEGPTQIELNDNQITLLAESYRFILRSLGSIRDRRSPISNRSYRPSSKGLSYQEVTGNQSTDDLELIRSYQPSWDWYSGFKTIDRVDVRVYNYDLLAPGFDLLSFVQANHQGKLTSQIRQFLIKKVKLRAGFNSKKPAVVKITRSKIYSSPLVVLVHKLTGKDPDLIIEDLIELSDLDQPNSELATQYQEIFNLVSDLYQTLILVTPPLDQDIILFGSGQFSTSSFHAGSLDVQNWVDSPQLAELIYVPAGSRILPYYQTSDSYSGDMRLNFLLPLGTQFNWITQERITLSHPWALKVNYYYQGFISYEAEIETESSSNQYIPTIRHTHRNFSPGRLELSDNQISLLVNIYRVDESSPLEQPEPLSFHSPLASFEKEAEGLRKANKNDLKIDLTTINYNKPFDANFQFPSRLSPEITYTYEFISDNHTCQLVGNVADLFYRTKKFITQEEPGSDINQFLNSYLPNPDWMTAIHRYLRDQEYRFILFKAYTVNGDRLINGYLREQITFRQFLVERIEEIMPDDPSGNQGVLRLFKDKPVFPLSLSSQLWDFLLKKLETNSKDLDSDLLEYALYGSSRDPGLNKYDILAYEISVDLQNLILEAPPLDQEVIVYRGINKKPYDLQCQPGEEFIMKGMVSTSLSLLTAANFGCHIYIIRVPAGSQVLPLNLAESKLADEEEILLPHGCTFILDQCLSLPYLEIIGFCHSGSENQTSLNNPCDGQPIHFYFCRLVNQPTVGP